VVRRAVLSDSDLLGMLGLVGIAYGLKPADIGGDIVAIGPYIVSHIGLGLTLVLLYVLVILAACYSTIDVRQRSAFIDRSRRHRQAILSADHGRQPVRDHQAVRTRRRHCRNPDRPVGSRFHHAGADDLCTEDVGPVAARSVDSLAENQHGGFCRGIVAAIAIGMPIYEMAGELIGTLSIVAISGLTVLVAGLVSGTDFDLSGLKRITDEVSAPRNRHPTARPRVTWAHPHPSNHRSCPCMRLSPSSASS
jgi:hypothetical protein